MHFVKQIVWGCLAIGDCYNMFEHCLPILMQVRVLYGAVQQLVGTYGKNVLLLTHQYHRCVYQWHETGERIVCADRKVRWDTGGGALLSSAM